MKERLDYIDRAKGILIILVVIGHIWQSGYVPSVIYKFHMPAFFAISGMLLHYTQSYNMKFRKFVTGRIFAYGIPFVFIESLGCLTDILRNGITLNWKGYLYNTLTFHFNDGNLWFLVALFLVEVIFVLAKQLLKKDKAVGCVCAFLFLISAFLPKDNPYIEVFFRTFRHFLFFTAGFYGFDILTKKNIPAWIASTGVVFFSATALGGRAYGNLLTANIAFIICGLCGTYMVIQLGKVHISEKLDKVLSVIGGNTIIIYGTHHIYYASVGVILGNTDFASTPLWAGLIMLTAVAVLEVPTIYAINRWFPFLAGRHRKSKEMSR